MKTRNLNLAILTENENIVEFINSISAEDFVRIHQKNLKNHYLSNPDIELDHLVEELDIMDIIREKYNEFFNEKGIQETYKWLNPSLFSNYSSYLKNEDFSMDFINYEVFGIELDNEDDYEACYELFNELYFESYSGWGYSSFMKELLSMYNYELV